MIVLLACGPVLVSEVVKGPMDYAGFLAGNTTIGCSICVGVSVLGVTEFVTNLNWSSI